LSARTAPLKANIMDKILLLFKKEIKAFMHDKAMVSLLIVGPVFFSFFSPMPYRNVIARNIPVAVIDNDHTYYSRELSRMLNATEQIKAVYDYRDLQSAREALIEKKVHGIIVIDNDFQRNILRGVPEEVKIYSDASYMSYYKQVTAGAQAAIRTFSAGVEIEELSVKYGKQAVIARSPVTLVTRNLYNVSTGYLEYIIPANYANSMQQTLMSSLCIWAFARRSSRKKYKKIFKPFDILMARALTFLCFGLGYFVFLFGFMFKFIWNGANGHNFLGGAMFVIPFFLSVTFLATFISGFFEDRDTISPVLVVCSMPLMFSAGGSWPWFMMPDAIRVFRLFLPNVYGLDGILKIFVMDAPFSAALGSYISLWALTLLYGFLAFRAIKKRYPYMM